MASEIEQSQLSNPLMIAHEQWLSCELRKPGVPLSCEGGEQWLSCDQMLIALIAQAPVAIALFDLHLRYLAASDRWCSTYGVTASEVVGSSLYETFPETPPEWREFHRRSLAGETLRREEECFDRDDGSTVWLRWEMRPWKYAASGGIGGVTIFTEDVTAFKQTQASLKEAKQRADEANLAKSRFLSNMSHELRTPFNSMLGFAQLLQQDSSLSEAQLEYVERIIGAGHHLLELINQVLDLSKIEGNHVDLVKEEVDLAVLLQECVGLVEPLADARGVSLYVSGLDLPQTLLGDSTRLKQVMFNLLSNGIKYNRPGGRVEVGLSRDQRWYRLAVQDTGRGIPNEQLTEIFDPFFRLQRDSAGEMDGSGIGLALVKQLVALMQGRVEVESVLGIGSCFTVLLPLMSGPLSESGEPHSTEADEHEICALERDCLVLYIEDNAQNRDLMEAVFEAHPRIRLITAESASMGLVMARERSPKLILLDINMPELNGYQVLKLLRSDPRLNKVPVVAVTANALQNQVAEGRKAGFDDYVTKPLSVPKLVQLVESFLKWQ